MEVLLDSTFATTCLGHGHTEVPQEAVEKFERWIHALVHKTGNDLDFNDI